MTLPGHVPGSLKKHETACVFTHAVFLFFRVFS